jgi:hypothetical protein
MNLRELLEKFESDAKNDISTFIDFVEKHAQSLVAPFHKEVEAITGPSSDDGNPTTSDPIQATVDSTEAPVEAPVEALVQTPVEATVETSASQAEGQSSSTTI